MKKFEVGQKISFSKEVGYASVGVTYVIEYMGKRTFSIRNLETQSGTDLPLWAFNFATIS